MAQSWADIPLDRPISITGVNAEQLVLTIESWSDDAPATIMYNATLSTRAADLVAGVLTELDRVARELFPAWLPEATMIESAAGAGIVAVRALALRAAASGGQYGPFLADLAERSLRPGARHTGPFDAEVRAIGLARVIARSFTRDRTVIVVPVDDSLSIDQHQALVTGARWLSDIGRFGVWFVGAPLRTTDAVETISFTPSSSDAISTPTMTQAVITYPAIAGRPHPGSRAEQLLESALAAVDWAAGREWNQLYRPHPLINPVRLDLLWREERCIVEIDGSEHCHPLRFAADRQRDVFLQLAGYAVLRFTNQQVLTHRDLVLAQIQQFLAGRRAPAMTKGLPHAGPEAVAAAAGVAAYPHG